MDKAKITNHQLFALTANCICGSAIIVISGRITSIAKQDAWMSALLAPIFGMLEIWIITFLGSLYPDMTYVEIITKILGRWIGWIVAAGFVLLCIIIAPVLPWYMGEFITIQVMPETPVYVINAVIVTAIVIAVLYGIETIARASEVFIYFVSFLFIISMLLVLPNAKIENLLPMIEKGITPILSGAFILSSYLTFPAILLFMVYPANMDSISEAKKSFLKGYLWAGFLTFISTIVSLLVLGSTVNSSSQFPIYLLAKEINIGKIFTRLEFIIAGIWIVTLFTRGIMYFYASVIGISQLLGLKDHKKIVLPLGLITLVMSDVVFPDTIYEANWDTFVWPPYIITFAFILPILLILVFFIKKWVLKMEVGEK